ncbi:class II glutamine amidotransferase [Lentibacter algarum]|uniref:class II glutamine amidotransferase n=1 Tax=Lentibacter algarum TaxID=576131 RepID=UPI001C068F03|nr:class II glutamine amidotransferase [Lentibacter algarum]MBU2982380.1 class II glutamine amidotransferase [Lentibacter algarum]
MCRWAAYLGAPVYLEDLVSNPNHSLIVQSKAADECKTSINADGFGLAWYDSRPEPGLYRDVFPAWSDPNLRSLCQQVRSGAFLAHVRASTGTAISRNNCHPFTYGKWSFVHNGQAGGYEHWRKSADMLIGEEQYMHRKGATDSEALFLIAAGLGLEEDPIGAVEQAVAKMEALASEKGATPHMRFAAALTDGETLYAFRYASDDRAPTLYHRWSASRQGFAVVSEPLVEQEEGWEAQTAGTVAVLRKGAKELRKFGRIASATRPKVA